MARILAVDDEESLRFTFECFLSEEGHEVITAWDYNEALHHVSNREFDLIFSDIILGGRTGIDLLREFRVKNVKCPVVMITGYPDVETASEAVRLGAFDYIAKPLEKETILRVTDLALQDKKETDEKERYSSNLEAIFRSVGDAIITVDKDLHVMEINEAAGSILGLDRKDIGKEFSLLALDCKEKFLEVLMNAMGDNRPVRACHVEYPAEEGHYRILNLSVHPLIGCWGMPAGAVMVVRDESVTADLEQAADERWRFHNFVGRSGQMLKVYSLIEALADVDTTVLVTGESGTGKELVADALHAQGSRSLGPLVKINCSVLSENLLESELFGHVKGAFTGALNNREGRFQKADCGTIFLDEIGDISPKVQSSLLRFLQEKEFERVGDSTPIRVDVRVIAATNKDLSEKVKRGEFREDLLYRLKVMEVSLPPLRDRREDIPLLVQHFLEKFSKKLNREIVDISSDVESIFMNYEWPGNVRELEHALEHAFVLCRNDIIAIDHLPANLKHPVRTERVFSGEKNAADADAILRALEKTAGNKARASRMLGISRKTLYRNIEKYNIDKTV